MKEQELIRRLKGITNGVSIIKNFQILKSNGMPIDEIVNVIQDMKLPLRIHLFIMGNFSQLMELKIG